MSKQSLKRYLVAVLATTHLAVFTTIPVAQASMVGTPEVLQQQQYEVNRDQLQAMLDDQKVQEKLAEMGVSRADLESRINSLTPAELAKFNQSLTQDPAGAGWGVVVIVALVVFMITDAMCVTNIFRFMKCV